MAEADAEQLISELEKLQGQKPKSFVPDEDDDIRRLGRMLDIRDPDDPSKRASLDYLKQFIEMNKPDPNEFSPNYGYQKPGTPDDDGGEAHPVVRPPSGSHPPEGVRANPTPKSVQGTTSNFGLRPGKHLGQGDAVAEPSARERRPRQTSNRVEKTPKVTIRFQ